MVSWTVTNHDDGNVSFEVKADNYEDAACEALSKLGWSLSVAKKDEKEND